MHALARLSSGATPPQRRQELRYAIGERHFLSGIDHVRKREVVTRSERFHVVEGVLDILVGVVWHYGNRSNTDLA